MIKHIEEKFPFLLSKRILLLGANGQVGNAIQSACKNYGIGLMALGRDNADLSQPESLRKVVRESKPDIIINAAAYTAVDKAEIEVDQAKKINADAPKVLAEEAEALGALIVHYSTDYVFDGRSEIPYLESDQPNPLSVYGCTKYEGEKNIKALCSRHLIFRTSWVFHEQGMNFLKTILRLSEERESLHIVSDQHGAPTPAKLIAEITFEMIALLSNAVSDDARWGTYHLTSSGETTWYGYAKYIVGLASQLGFRLKTNIDTIIPIKTSEYPLPAVRPTNSRLNTKKVSELLSLKLPAWEDGVEHVLNQLYQQEKA
ncbi:MAG: dTDP-4-dehydrorhamnose reductase [Pseudomonadota bacterium]